MSLKDLQGTYVLDPTHTTLSFIARHAMVTKVRGSFEEFEGTAVIGGENESLDVTIQVASVNTRNSQRDNHLRTSDFFEAEKYPTITFKGTSYEITGDDTVDITGDLTIKDVTKSITIPFEYQGTATDPFGNERSGFEGQVTVTRADWGLTYNSALEAGGVLISDKIILEFEVSAIKQA